jgi:hypothetical protein
MKKNCFFLFLIFPLFCFNSKGQTVKNTDVNGNKNTINSVLPPQISFPSNESVVDISNPVFIWIPPGTTNRMMVTYSLRLVEVQKGQTLA